MTTFKVYYWNSVTKERGAKEFNCPHPDQARAKFYGDLANTNKRILKVKVVK